MLLQSEYRHEPRSERARRELAEDGLLELAEHVVAMHPRVSLDNVLDRCRFPEVAEARAHLIYELYDVLGTYPRVASTLGLDHTTCIHARRRWARVVGDVGVFQGRRAS